MFIRISNNKLNAARLNAARKAAKATGWTIVDVRNDSFGAVVEVSDRHAHVALDVERDIWRATEESD